MAMSCYRPIIHVAHNTQQIVSGKSWAFLLRLITPKHELGEDLCWRDRSSRKNKSNAWDKSIREGQATAK